MKEVLVASEESLHFHDMVGPVIPMIKEVCGARMKEAVREDPRDWKGQRQCPPNTFRALGISQPSHHSVLVAKSMDSEQK